MGNLQLNAEWREGLQTVLGMEQAQSCGSMLPAAHVQGLAPSAAVLMEGLSPTAALCCQQLYQLRPAWSRV